MKLPNHVKKLIQQPPLFATPAMICACCHIVRGCKSCCKVCLAKGVECNSYHECANEERQEDNDDSSEWWVSVTSCFAEWCWDVVPVSIIKKLK